MHYGKLAGENPPRKKNMRKVKITFQIQSLIIFFLSVHNSTLYNCELDVNSKHAI